MNPSQEQHLDRKYSKAEVHFEHPARGENHCSQCVHFEVERPNGCEVVAGYIAASDWCDQFKAKAENPYLSDQYSKDLKALPTKEKS
jgi:hypothetical protein